MDWSIRTKRKPTAEHVTGPQQKPLQAFEKQAFVDKLSKLYYITYCFSYLTLLQELTVYMLYQSNWISTLILRLSSD